VSTTKSINWKKYSYSEEQLKEAVTTSTSFRQVMIKLGIKGEGGGYKIVRRIINVLNLDTKHFNGQNWSKGKTLKGIKRRTTNELLVVGSDFQSYKLKLRLLEDNLILNQCSECNISEWKGQKLSLHLDHINGVNNDNRLENLRLLCPNCHSQTSTYCGKNKKKK
jgi:hypothetical protein